VQITKVVGFLFWTQQNWFGIFLIFLRISRNFTRRWTELQRNLDRVLNNYALDFYAKHPRQNSMLAIGPLAGEGGAAPAKSGEPAAIPAGQVARLDHTLT
jgi:hypothetical protein